MRAAWPTLAVLSLTGLLGGAGPCLAGPYTFVADPPDDASAGPVYEVFGLGYRLEAGYLDLFVATNLPPGGVDGGDSYRSFTHLLPGDLYVNVGGSHNLHTGSVYGLAVTSHAGSAVTSDPAEQSGLSWAPVTAGHLYAQAVFSTGTYERYPHAGPTGTPDDGDGLDSVNSYPALIADYTADLGPQALSYTAVVGQPWAYELHASLSLAQLGLAGQPFEVWWSMGCGNDAAMAAGPVPEPGTAAALLLAAVVAVARRRGRRLVR